MVQTSKVAQYTSTAEQSIRTNSVVRAAQAMVGLRACGRLNPRLTARSRESSYWWYRADEASFERQSFSDRRSSYGPFRREKGEGAWVRRIRHGQLSRRASAERYSSVSAEDPDDGNLPSAADPSRMFRRQCSTANEPGKDWSLYRGSAFFRRTSTGSRGKRAHTVKSHQEHSTGQTTRFL